ncbi:uncharacterized protein LOC123313059 [Coccinella septempunctata]|uniref:uncharacterized protein LOC123313059 n=1 Tax=Coccinella septempunctata TaxID=41139 RepID=UPI001D086F14|nr:uncharacterized protein LOC123313059 [Coccinella septempunctata]
MEVSLFSNVTLEAVIDSVNLHWDSIGEHCPLQRGDFLECVRLVFNTTYCQFQEKFFKQTKGTPMGTDSSSIFAEMVVDDILDRAFSLLCYTPLMTKKYVDDLFCILRADQLGNIIRVLNDQNIHINFTHEVETNSTLPYLDLQLIRNDDNTISTDWYQKPTASGRYLNYKSSHEHKQKINLILGMKGRLEKLVSPRHLQNSLHRLADLLNSNSYPRRLINKILFNTPGYTTEPHAEISPHTPQDVDQATPVVPRFFSLPYHPAITPRIIKTISHHVVDRNMFLSAKYMPNTLGRHVFSRMKDITPIEKRAGIVYAINCTDCDKTYIGQTGRNLKTRLREHVRDCAMAKQTTGLSKHCYEMNHTMNFGDAKILKSESNRHKREFLEAVEIMSRDNNLNINTDFNGINSIYCNIVNLINKPPTFSSPYTEHPLPHDS